MHWTTLPGQRGFTSYIWRYTPRPPLSPSESTFSRTIPCIRRFWCVHEFNIMGLHVCSQYLLDVDAHHFVGTSVHRPAPFNHDRSPAGPFAPSQVVAPIDITHPFSPSLLKDVVLIDFGQSFFADHPWPNYAPATPLHYLSPEAFFESQTSFTSDVWAQDAQSLKS